MNRGKIRWIVPVVGIACLAAYEPVSADRLKPAAYQPSRQDALALALLAPPAPSSTARVSYGDASLVHPRSRDVDAAHQPGSNVPVVGYVCRRPGGGTKLCIRNPCRTGVRDLYLYAPAYATAPQIRRTGRSGETSLLPPSTKSLVTANAFLFGAHEDE